MHTLTLLVYSQGLLFEIFNTVGPVASIRVCRDAVTRRSLGYAYVNFHNVSDAERALDTMNYTLIKSKPCRIMWSQRDPTLRKSGVGNVFVKNLDASIDHKALFDTFSLFGNILSCKVATDETGQSQGYGYVHYESEEAATDAISKINSMTICDKEVYVGHFVRRTERSGQADWTNLYVKNFPAEWDESNLRKTFELYGAITSCKVQPLRISIKPKAEETVGAKEAISAAQEAMDEAKHTRHDAGEELPPSVARSGSTATSIDVNSGESSSPTEVSAFGWVNFEHHDSAVAAIEALNGASELPQKESGSTIHLKAPLFVGRAQKKVERERELKAKFDAAKIERIKKYQGVNLFVKNLDDALDDDQLREHFAEFGTITSARIMREPASGTSRGFGFVCFSSPEEAAKAVTEMNNKLVLGKPIFVALAQRKEVRRAQLEAQHAQRRTPGPYGTHPGTLGPGGVPSHGPQGLHPAHLAAPYGAAMPIMYAAGTPGGHPMGIPPQGHPGVPISSVPPNARGYVMARGSPRGPIADPRTGFHGGGPRQGAYPIHPGQMQQMGGQGSSNRRSRNRGGQGAQAQGGQQYKYTQNARNAANMAPSMTQLPPQAHLMPPTVGQQPGQGFPGGPGVAPPMPPPLPLQQPSASGSGQSPRRPPEDPLTLSALANASPTLQKNMIGERLYPLIHHSQPELAGKITGMLLEMDNSELLHLLESPDALRMKVAEALEVLKQHQAQLQQVSRED